MKARRVILATGVLDNLPAIPGLAERWGVGVLECPYCDGWEMQHQAVAVLGADDANIGLALMLSRFTDDLVLCTNRAPAPAGDQADQLRRRRVQVRTEGIDHLDGPGQELEQIVFADGTTLERAYAFTHPPTRQASTLHEQLGLEMLDDGSIKVDDIAQTSVPGVFAAGDLARRPTMPVPGAQLVIAAAEGVVAAVAVDQLLFLEDLAPAAT